MLFISLLEFNIYFYHIHFNIIQIINKNYFNSNFDSIVHILKYEFSYHIKKKVPSQIQIYLILLFSPLDHIFKNHLILSNLT